MVIVKEHEPREYSAITCNKAIVLCDKQEGAFLVCRFPEDIERLRELLATIEITPLCTE